MSEITTTRSTVVTSAVIAVGLSAGFFVTYAISVTPALAQVDDLIYIRTFQAINETVRTGWFATFFFGALPLLVTSASLTRGRARALLAGAALVYAVGVLGVTFAGNVPMNNDLATHTGLTSETAAGVRADFEDPWNRLNLVRTAACLVAFTAAAVARGSVRSVSRGEHANLTRQHPAVPVA